MNALTFFDSLSDGSQLAFEALRCVFWADPEDELDEESDSELTDRGSASFLWLALT